MNFVPTNKKNRETSLMLKKTKLMPIKIQKNKKTQELRLKIQLCNQPRDPRISTFDSLELKQFVCCEGIKLGYRRNNSVEKKNYKKIYSPNQKNIVQYHNQGIKLCKASTSDSLSLDLKSLVIRNYRFFEQRMLRINPQQLSHLRNIPKIARNDILISKKIRNQMNAFLIKQNKIVVLCEQIKDFKLVGSHPNLLQPQSLISIDSGSYFIVDECNRQNLKSLVNQFGKIHHKLVIQYIREVVSALCHLKIFGQSHNRINMETILHDGEGSIIVNWIKSSNKMPVEQEKSKYFYYLCPEILLAKSQSLGEKADVWAVGCLALQLISNISPKNNPLHPYNRKSSIYRNPDTIQTIKKIQALLPDQTVDKAVPLSPKKPNINQVAQFINISSLQFIGKCLSVNIDQRPNLNQLLHHPFMK